MIKSSDSEIVENLQKFGKKVVKRNSNVLNPSHWVSKLT